MSTRHENTNHHVLSNRDSLVLEPPSVPKSVELDTRIEMASWAFAQKDFDRTTEYAERVLDEVPGDPRALALIAGCQILIGNLDAGIIGLKQAINCTAIERYEAAVDQAYDHLRFCDDETVEISWSGFNDCIQFLSQPEFGSDEDETAWMTVLERARACVALERGDVQVGIEDLRTHLRRFPSDVEAKFELGRGYFHAGQNRVAGELLKLVLDEKPDHEFALSLLAKLHASDSDYAQAIQYASEAFELNPQSCLARLDLVEYLYDNHEFEKALDLMSDAPHCDCGWFRILHARMECYCRLGDFDAVMDNCQQMLVCEPDEVSADIDLELGKRIAMGYYILSIAKVDGPQNAMLKLEQESDLLIDEKWFTLEVVSLYREFEEYELAGRLIECLSYELPDDPDVILAQSIAEFECGNAANEKMLLRQLIQLTPDWTLAYLRMSASCELDGQLKEALFWADRGASLGDSEGRFEYVMARIYCQLEAFELGRQFLIAAISSNNSFRGRAKVDELFAPLNLAL